MIIYDGNSINELVLYSLSQLIKENESPLLAKFEPQDGNYLPLLVFKKYVCFKDETEDDMINNIISNYPSVTQPTYQI